MCTCEYTHTHTHTHARTHSHTHAHTVTHTHTRTHAHTGLHTPAARSQPPGSREIEDILGVMVDCGILQPRERWVAPAPPLPLKHFGPEQAREVEQRIADALCHKVWAMRQLTQCTN